MMMLRSSVGISNLIGRFSLSVVGAGCCGGMVVGEKMTAFVFASWSVLLRLPYSVFSANELMTYLVLCEGLYQIDVHASAMVANDSAVLLGKRSCLLPRLMMLEAEGEG
jgi:hypothetical protein